MKRKLVIFRPAKQRTSSVVSDGERVGYLEKVVVDEETEA